MRLGNIWRFRPAARLVILGLVQTIFAPLCPAWSQDARSPAKAFFQQNAQVIEDAAGNPHPISSILEDYHYDQWTVENGLPQNTVLAIAQTPDGYLWFGTYDGLVRFDGLEFKIYDHSNIPAFAESEAVNSLATDGGGNLWIGNYNGLHVLRPDGFFRIGKEHGLFCESINRLVPGRWGGMWILTRDGLVRFQNQAFKTIIDFKFLDSLGQYHGVCNIKAIIEDDRNGLFLGGSWGYRRWDLEFLERITLPKTAEAKGPHVNAILADSQENVWLGRSSGVGLGREMDFQNKAGLVKTPGERTVRVDLIKETSDGRLWAAQSNYGLFMARNDGGEFEWIREFQNSRVACFHEDLEGNVWLGLDHEGLVRLRPKRIQTHVPSGTRDSRFIWSVCERKAGGLWVGMNEGYGKFENGFFVQFNSIIGGAAQSFRSVFEDSKGRLWLAHNSGLKIRLDGELFTFEDPTQPTTLSDEGLDQARCVVEDFAGHVWCGSNRGLYRIGDGRIETYDDPIRNKVRFFKASNLRYFGLEAGLSNTDVHALLVDSMGAVWIGTAAGGVFHFLDEEITPIVEPIEPGSDEVLCLLETKDGSIWIGKTTGLMRCKNGTIHRFAKKQGLVENTINAMLEDDLGNLWFGGLMGIYRVAIDELDAVAEGRAESFACVRYGKADGMLSAETNGGNTPSALKTREGLMYFPTIQGIAMFDPGKLAGNERPPPIVITKASANKVDFLERYPSRYIQIKGSGSYKSSISRGDSTSSFAEKDSTLAIVLNRDPKSYAAPGQSELRLPPGSGRLLEFNLAANSLGATERNRFRYKLEGHEEQWTESKGLNRQARYANIKPGSYVFRMQGADHHGIWAGQEAALRFAVLPYFHQTLAFRSLCLAALALAVLGVFRLRIRRLARLHQLENQLLVEKERTRIAGDIHDDLGTQLSKIGCMSEVAKLKMEDPGQARSLLDEIIEHSRGLTSNLGEIIWITKPSNDNLQATIAYLRRSSARTFDPTSIAFQFKASETIPEIKLKAEWRRNFLLACKEALHNALKHAKPKRVSMSLALDENRLECRIQDDGQGFDPDSKNPDGNGLQNMRNRMSALDGSLKIESRIGKGTLIVFSMPF